MPCLLLVLPHDILSDRKRTFSTHGISAFAIFRGCLGTGKLYHVFSFFFVLTVNRQTMGPYDSVQGDQKANNNEYCMMSAPWEIV